VLGFDLLSLSQYKALKKLSADPVPLCNVLYLLCEDEAKRRGVSDEDFGRLLYGDGLYNGLVAVLEGLADFLPADKRAIIASAIAMMKNIVAKMESLEPASATRQARRKEARRLARNL
jgi:hypothetical protein